MTFASLLLALLTATAAPRAMPRPARPCSTSMPSGADRATRPAPPSSN